jgi:Ca-activated chloride channel homolog
MIQSKSSLKIKTIDSVGAKRCKLIHNIPSVTNLYQVDHLEKSLALTGLHLEGEIHNSTAVVSYRQSFKNTEDSPIECVYKFPSDRYFAVTGLHVKVGEKEIDAEIMEKEKAEEKYDDAVAAGHTAAKMNFDKKLPDVIELNIGQLQKEQEAEITVKMV